MPPTPSTKQPPRLEKLPNNRWRIEAPAKLNLGLRVFPARPDGFHDLQTWMAPLSWHDTLTVGGDGPLTLHITGRAHGIPTDLDKNLVSRAALKLAAAARIQPRGTIELHKVLPPGGGLGGGSSDAANALVALNHAWALAWPEERLLTLAAELGSDVPFFVHARPSLCTGRGEIMTDLRRAAPLFAVLLIPPGGCPTKDVYAAFDAGAQHPPVIRDTPTDWTQAAHADVNQLSARLINDLEPAAFTVAPWLKDLRTRAAKIANRPVHMTGSGSTLFTLCASGAQAEETQNQLQHAFPPEITCIAARIL